MKFGITIMLNKVYVEPIKKEETSTSLDFNYVIEIIPVENCNDKGHNLLKIYSNGVLEVIQTEKWKIPPIIRMPFNLHGYSVYMELIDKNDNSIIKACEPDVTNWHKVSFIREIQWIFDTILKLSSIEDKEHFELLEQIEKANKNFSYWDGKPIIISFMKKSCDELEEIINKYKIQKERLNEEQNDYLKTLINELVALINRYKLTKIE